MRDVICNTSPIQYLHQVALLSLIRDMYDRILIPEAVRAEIADGISRGVDLPRISEMPWIGVRHVRNRDLLPLVADLGPGEREVIALAQETPGSLVIIDDLLARRYAAHVGLEVAGTLAILVKGKRQGLLPSVAPALDRLDALRFRLDPVTRRAVLDLADESR